VSAPTVAAAGTFVAVMALLWPAEAVAGRPPAAGIGRPHRSRPARLAPPTSWRRAGGGFALAVLVTGALLWSVPLAVLGLVVVSIQRLVAGHRRTARDRRSLDDSVPESIDLCTVVLGAGGTIRDCLDALAGDGPAPVRTIAADVARRADGAERVDGRLRRLQAELGPSFQPLTGALLLAVDQGGSVGSLLARLTVEANAGRRRRGELRARRLPVALLVPLVICSLPAVIIGTVIPLLFVAAAGVEL